jgi:integrase
VVVSVPRNLQTALGKTKLKRSLETESLSVANRLKHGVIQELKNKLHVVAKALDGDDHALALRWKDKILKNEWAKMELMDQIQDLLVPVHYDPETDEYMHNESDLRRATILGAVHDGQTPYRSFVEEWHVQVIRKERTRGDDDRAMEYLHNWCRSKNLAFTIESVSGRLAGDFVGDLLRGKNTGTGPLSPKTVNKYISSLSSYHKWLKRRHYVEANVWLDQSLQKPRADKEIEERPFTDSEVVKLLNGKPSYAVLPGLMRIAALTGARIDALASLKVRDCQDGSFHFKAQKREIGTRKVPIHSELAGLIADLVAGKGPESDLFPELPIPPKGSGRERSMPASKAFTRYRRLMGVDDQVQGHRRSRVNFHSFRRWFITKAEQAGQQPHIIEALVGHKREGMSLGRYSAGPSFEQLKACIEAVRLP